MKAFSGKHLLIVLVVLVLIGCKTKQKVTDDSATPVLKKIAVTNVVIDEVPNYMVGTSEPSITCNPQNPQQLIAGSVYDNVYTSDDAGQTWSKSQLMSSLGVFGDPCLVADNRGHTYYLHLAGHRVKGHNDPMFLNSIVLQRSDDNGKTWSDGTSIGANSPKKQDKEWAVIDPDNGNIYVTWTEFDQYDSNNPSHKSRIRFAKSTDFGQTFSDAITISSNEGTARDDWSSTEGAVPAVDKQGHIYVAWGLNEKIYFNKSIDGGKTWLEKDLFVAGQTGGWDMQVPGVSRCNGMPVTVVDNSESPYQGTIYINWTDARHGKDNIDVFLIKSSDGGKTWSKPVRVNQDNTRTQQYLTWMTVDPVTGYLYFVYFDRSLHTGNQTEVVVTVSKDGGETFQSYIVSEQPFVSRDGVFLGDYNNIIAYDGMVRPIWTSLNGDKKSIRTALIDHL